MMVVAKGIKRSLDRAVVKVTEVGRQILLVRQGVVKHMRIPEVRGHQDDVGQISKLLLGGCGHLEVGKPIDDIKWNKVAIKSADALAAANLNGMIINVILVVLDLPR